MSLISDADINAGVDLLTASETRDEQPNSLGAVEGVSFRFVPRELAIKCRTLIESYHSIHGYAGLPDMLWHSDARDFIECHRDLSKIFKLASKSRCAKRADDLFVLIATVIVAMEVLSRDFAGWGARFPSARREAEGLLETYLLRHQMWLMDRYLYPHLGINRKLAVSLSPSPAKLSAAAG
jgi:hypothetical protein